MTGAFMSTDAKTGKVQGVVIGIDLGTTNSCVSVMDGRTPKVRFFLQEKPNSLAKPRGR
jgi:molecular chaperone DnaK (HSP70)